MEHDGKLENWRDAKSIYDFSAKNLKGETISLEKYKGNVCIITNTASLCLLTKTNIDEFNGLFEKYGDSKGLRILAFPCNQFANQQPGGTEEICRFVAKNNIKFDVFQKIDVNGSSGHPLWKYLKHRQGGIVGDFIKWNFTKFIVDRNGQPVERHGPNVSPMELEKALEKYW